ncbi:hypothetical protein [Paenibacillus tyrfis]|uniref:hypothetical protein n=1 Tax=Paenibacillus tyrfis TaxID=1501230 RepID=UPI000B591DA8|nr:hypothetical protein [Paenibacillus tyrfis]
MNKHLSLITATLLLSASLLSACGSAPAPSAQATNGQASLAPSKTENKTVSDAAIKEGTAKLLKTAKQLTKAATAGDEAKIKELGH